VDLTFSTAVNPYSFDSTASNSTRPRPGGLQLHHCFDAQSHPVSVYFPQQTALGAYTITGRAAIEDLYGQTMSQAYTGTFAISLPFIKAR